MFTVTGTIDGIGYRVGVHPDGLADEPEALGCVMGSGNALAHLSLHDGQPFQATPTSEPADLDIESPESVLAFLHGTTSVTAVAGDVIPDVIPNEVGVNY